MRLRNSSKEPLPISQLGREFCHYFNCGKYFIYKSNDKWYTETRFPLTPRTLWRRYQDPSQIIGIRFDNQTNFFVLDIDIESKYHYKYDPLSFYQLRESLEKIGINETVALQSSNKGGMHLFGFLPQKLKSFNLACALEKVLTTNGFVIKPGQLEIFPNPKPYNPTGEKSCGFNGIRLPLQPEAGSKLYNKKMRLVNGGLKKFLRLANKSTQEQNMGILKRYANRAVKWHKEQKTTNYQQQRRENYRRDMEVSAFTGWSDRGETNEILKSISNYGWVMMELRTWQELAEYIETTAISLPGYEQYCQHKHEIKLRAKHWAKSGCRYWAQKWHYPDRKGKTYKEFINDTETAINVDLKRNCPIYNHRYTEINQRRQSEFYERLTTCIKAIEKLPDKVGDCISLLQQKSQELFGIKFSVKTLKKPEYRKHWHYKYRPQRLPSAPYTQLKAIAKISEYLQQAIEIVQKKISKILHSQNDTKRDIQNKPPHQDVVQTTKIAEKESSNLDISIDSQIDPTMKCLVAFSSVSLEVLTSALNCWINKIKIELNLTKDKVLELSREEQAKSQSILNTKETITPSICNTEKSSKSELVQTIVPESFQENERTLMKCLRVSPPYLLSRTLVLEMELIKNEIKLELEKLIVPETEIKTSETKLAEINQARKKTYFYQGRALFSHLTSSRKKVSYYRKIELERLEPGARVKITGDIHSSSLSDDVDFGRQILVYVRPVDSKTKTKYAVALSNLVIADSNSYIQAVLPQIKSLVQSLGLTKEDYLKHLEETYGAEKTGQLYPAEIVEVMSYFQNLGEEVIDSVKKVLKRSFTKLYA